MVKRVIGLPGDRIELLNNQVFVNGETLAYEELDSWFVEQIPASARPAHLFASESLEGRKHPLMVTPGRPAPRTGGPFIVVRVLFFPFLLSLRCPISAKILHVLGHHYLKESICINTPETQETR